MLEVIATLLGDHMVICQMCIYHHTTECDKRSTKPGCVWLMRKQMLIGCTNGERKARKDIEEYSKTLSPKFTETAKESGHFKVVE